MTFGQMVRATVVAFILTAGLLTLAGCGDDNDASSPLAPSPVTPAASAPASSGSTASSLSRNGDGDGVHSVRLTATLSQAAGRSAGVSWETSSHDGATIQIRQVDVNWESDVRRTAVKEHVRQMVVAGDEVWHVGNCHTSRHRACEGDGGWPTADYTEAQCRATDDIDCYGLDELADRPAVLHREMVTTSTSSVTLDEAHAGSEIGTWSGGSLTAGTFSCAAGFRGAVAIEVSAELRITTRVNGRRRGSYQNRSDTVQFMCN